MISSDPMFCVRKIGFLLIPGFSNFELHAFLDAFAVARDCAHCPVYDIYLISNDQAGPVKGSNDIVVWADHSIHTAPPLDYVFACAGRDATDYVDSDVRGWLRSLERRGSLIGCLSGGISVAAAAGLLDGKRCSVHWNKRVEFEECYEAVTTTCALFEEDGRIITCGGGAAALPLALHMISKDTSPVLSRKVAEVLLYDHRNPNGDQPVSLRMRLGTVNTRFLQAAEVMQANIEEPLDHLEIAQAVGLSRRQLQRCFKKYCGVPPRVYYQRIRLEKARALLRQTSLSVMDVSVRCGFASASHFAKTYVNYFDVRPSEDR